MDMAMDYGADMDVDYGEDCNVDDWIVDPDSASPQRATHDSPSASVSHPSIADIDARLCGGRMPVPDTGDDDDGQARTSSVNHCVLKPDTVAADGNLTSEGLVLDETSRLQGTMAGEEKQVHPDVQDKKESVKERSCGQDEYVSIPERTVLANGHFMSETTPAFVQNTGEEQSVMETGRNEMNETSVNQVPTGAVNALPTLLSDTHNNASSGLLSKGTGICGIIPVQDGKKPDCRYVKEPTFKNDDATAIQETMVTAIELPASINISERLLTMQTSLQGTIAPVKGQEECKSRRSNEGLKDGGIFTESSTSTESSEDSESSVESTEESEGEEESSKDASEPENFQKDESEKESGELTAGEGDTDIINQADTMSMEVDGLPESGKVKTHKAKMTKKKYNNQEYDSGSVEENSKEPIHSSNKLKILAPVPSVGVKLGPDHVLLPVGVISAVLGTSVVVEGIEGQNALNEGSILWLTNEKLPLGIVDEVFGPVKKPFYVVRYNAACDVPEETRAQVSVSYVPEFVSFILKNDPSLYEKGYDAADWNDEELADTDAEFSDDEKEAEYRRLRAHRKSDMEVGSQHRFLTDQKHGCGKHFQNRRANGNNRSDFNQMHNGCRQRNTNFRMSNLSQRHRSFRRGPLQQMPGRQPASGSSGLSLEQQRFGKWDAETSSQEILFRQPTVAVSDKVTGDLRQELESRSWEPRQGSANLYPEASSCKTQKDQQGSPHGDPCSVSNFSDQKPKFERHRPLRRVPFQQTSRRQSANRFSGQSLEQQRFGKCEVEISSQEILFRQPSEEQTAVVCDKATLAMRQELKASSLKAWQGSVTIYPEASSCKTQQDQQESLHGDPCSLSSFSGQKPKLQQHRSFRRVPLERMPGRQPASGFSGQSLEQQRSGKWEVETSSQEVLFKQHMRNEHEASCRKAWQGSASLHPEDGKCKSQQDQQGNSYGDPCSLCSFNDEKQKFQHGMSSQCPHQKMPEKPPDAMLHVSSEGEGFRQQQSIEKFQREVNTPEDLPLRSVPQEHNLEKSNIAISDVQSQSLKETGKSDEQQNHIDCCLLNGSMHSEGIGCGRAPEVVQKCIPSQGAPLWATSGKPIQQLQTTYGGPVQQGFENLHLAGNNSGQKFPYRAPLQEQRHDRMVSDSKTRPSKKFMESSWQDHAPPLSVLSNKGQHTVRHSEEFSKNSDKSGSWIPDYPLHNRERPLSLHPTHHVNFSVAVGTPSPAWGSHVRIEPQPAFQGPTALQLPVASFPQHLAQPVQEVDLSSTTQPPQIASNHGPGFPGTSFFPGPVLGVPVNPPVMANSMQGSFLQLPQMPFFSWIPTQHLAPVQSVLPLPTGQHIAPGQPSPPRRSPPFPAVQQAEWQNPRMNQMPYNFCQEMGPNVYCQHRGNY